MASWTPRRPRPEHTMQRSKSQPLGHRKRKSPAEPEAPTAAKSCGCCAAKATHCGTAEATPLTAPKDVDDCLCGSHTYEEYMRRIHSEVRVAWRFEYCRDVWGKQDELEAAINRLPTMA